jgi:hypothetical protein
VEILFAFQDFGKLASFLHRHKMAEGKVKMLVALLA